MQGKWVFGAKQKEKVIEAVQVNEARHKTENNRLRSECLKRKQSSQEPGRF